jgi:hypothetical protein
MGSTAKTKPVRFYGSLLRLYPQTFQAHYSATMRQTFADMLDNESTVSGRLKIWMRTLIDLPFSAAKEHITNGGGFTMARNTKLLVGCLIAAIFVAGGGSWWLGYLHARQTVGIERVTAAQLANAMQQDGFYSAYGDAAVLFSAKVSSVTEHDNAASVTFSTGRPYSVTCQFAGNVSAKSGQILSIAAPAGSAERQVHGVLLHNCLVN